MDGEQSSYLPLLSWVPQGSAIGPASFIIYINDLPEYVKSPVHLFADGTGVLLNIHSTEHYLRLQNNLKSLEDWENDWSMAFNPEKCKVLRISRKKTTSFHNYILHGVVLKAVTHAKFLGVHLTKDLKWNIQISKIVAKGNQTLSFLKKNLRVKSSSIKEKANKAILRPKLEYCSSIWDPRKDIENNGSYRLEKVQRRAARWVLSRYDPLGKRKRYVNRSWLDNT